MKNNDIRTAKIWCTALWLAIISPLASGQNVITGYQYWFDQNDPGTFVSQTPDATGQIAAEISYDPLAEGMHTLHLRFKNSSERWSATTSYRFFKTSVQGGRVWQFWWDDDLAGAKTTASNTAGIFELEAELDISALPEGFHTLHVRLLELGVWTSVSSFRFFKEDNSLPLGVQGYEYWWGGNFDQRTFQKLDNYPASGLLSLDDISTAGLPSGDNLFCIRFIGLRGWTSAICNLVKTSAAGEATTENFNLNVFPNPAAVGADVQILLELPQPEQVEVSLVGADGRESPVLFSKILPEGQHLLPLPTTSNLPAGSYFLKVLTSSGIGWRKLVVQ